MTNKTEAAEGYMLEQRFQDPKGIARDAFDAGWEAALFNLTEAIEGLTNKPTNTAPAIEFPDVIRTAADVALPWPEGTRVVDNHDDRWQMRGGVWTIVGWYWQDDDELFLNDYLLEKYLPARVQKEDN